MKVASGITAVRPAVPEEAKVQAFTGSYEVGICLEGLRE